MVILLSILQPTYVIIGIIVLIGLFVMQTYNRLVREKLGVDESFSAMDVAMKKRYDLIPNIVNTVKGYAAHEKDTFEAVVNARNAAVSATSPEEAAKAEGELNQVMSRLFALTESYPELKANENFLNLQDELSRIETEIGQSRRFYNSRVKGYNSMIKVFPSVLVANMFGFNEPYPMFEISEAERQTVEVKFWLIKGGSPFFIKGGTNYEKTN